MWSLLYCRSTGRRQRAKAYAWRLWRGWNVALVVVPLALAFMEVLAQRAELRFLLYPPLASIAYLLFTRPYLLFTRPVGPHAPMLSAITAPSIGAGISTLGTSSCNPGSFGAHRRVRHDTLDGNEELTGQVVRGIPDRD